MAVVASVCVPAWAAQGSFDGWLAGFQDKAVASGLPVPVVQSVLALAYEDPAIVTLDQKQPEGKVTFSQYRRNILTPDRINKGRALLTQNRALLAKISAKYGVPAKIIVALWGIETNYGAFTGKFNVIPSLATLAYEGRRADLFESELLATMRMVRDEHVKPEDMQGSWAGAMGQCQFMPSSFLKYAVDGNGDGQKDIWHSLPDVFASIANYLHTEGWDRTLTWGRPVLLPKGMKLTYESLYTPTPLPELAAKGITRADGGPLPLRDVNAYAMLPGEANEGAFIVYQNYHVLLHWNKSRYFATAVGLLADAIGGGA